MAHHADPAGVPKKRSGPRPRYPWHQWTDGEWWRLYQGVDYRIGTESFRSVAANHALRHDMRLSANATEDGILIRFTPKEDSDG
jgi:hypothetical protein